MRRLVPGPMRSLRVKCIKRILDRLENLQPVAERYLPPPPPKPAHLSSLGDPRGPLARMVAGGLVLVALVIGLLVYGGTQEGPDQTLEAQASGGGVAAAVASPSLWVNADPAGSTVFVDGDSVGAVPLWIDRVAEGRRRVRIVAPGGRTITDTTVSVEAGAVAELDLAPESPGAPPTDLAVTDAPEGSEDILSAPERPAPASAPVRRAPSAPTTGELRVSSSPSGAVVSIDGRRIGETPIAVLGVRPGRHSLSVQRRGYETSVRPVDIRPGGVFEAAIDLRPADVASRAPSAARPRPSEARPSEARPSETRRPATSDRPARSGATGQTGVLEVLVRPWGRIVVDGVVLHEATDVVYRAELTPGEHRVFVSNPRFGSDERVVTVEPGGQSRLEFNLASGQ